MPKSKNNRNGQARTKKKPEQNIKTNHPQDKPIPDDELVSVINSVKAKKNKSSTKVTLTYKGESVTLPGIQGLPYGMFVELFENAPTTHKEIAMMALDLATYFRENNEDFKKLAYSLVGHEVIALVMAWLGCQGSLPELGK